MNALLFLIAFNVHWKRCGGIATVSSHSCNRAAVAVGGAAVGSAAVGSATVDYAAVGSAAVDTIAVAWLGLGLELDLGEACAHKSSECRVGHRPRPTGHRCKMITEKKKKTMVYYSTGIQYRHRTI